MKSVGVSHNEICIDKFIGQSDIAIERERREEREREREDSKRESKVNLKAFPDRKLNRCLLMQNVFFQRLMRTMNKLIRWQQPVPRN